MFEGMILDTGESKMRQSHLVRALCVFMTERKSEGRQVHTKRIGPKRQLRLVTTPSREKALIPLYPHPL